MKMGLKKIEEIKNNLIPTIENLIKIIKEEYKDLVVLPENLELSNYVHIEDTGTISLFIRNGHFYFPTDAFKVLEALKKIPGFGCFPNHKTHNKDTIIINNNTYITYLEHVFLAGLTPQKYYEEILLHETMHFCGSGGGTAIREGINELKTRELAQKYNLLTSSCGYPKETKIAYELQNIFGEDIINKIAFSNSYLEIKNILDEISPDATNFYFSLEQMMEKEFYDKYMRHEFPGITGPIKKTNMYNKIDYSKAYKLIEEYKKSHNILEKRIIDNNRKKTRRMGFIINIMVIGVTILIGLISVIIATLIIK